ncbi:MAG: DUF4179 domain-containing protein [Peptococcaceae bacterium]|nr:DUF4179 domain-containing protein [Peptococcaceae bacterium]
MREQNFDEMLKTGMQEMNEGILPSAQLLADTRARMAQTKPRSKWVPRMQKAVAVAACTLVIFTGAVNLSPAFASAAANVPIVRELVKAVAFDPSMKAAIEHDYVQLVKKTATDNGFTLDVEYLVADPRNLTVYYKMAEITAFNENHYEQYRFDFDLLDMDGNDLEGYGASWDYPISEDEKEALNAVKFNFSGEETLPEQVQLRLIVKEAQPLSEEDQKKLDEARNKTGLAGSVASFEEPRPEYKEVANMIVPLTIDKGSLFNMRTLNMNRTVELDGQRIVFDKVEIYPTQIRVLWHTDETNTHLIDGLRIELQSKERGKWQGISNGVSGIGATDSPERQTWLESNWFSDEEEYQLVITQYALIPKDKRMVSYDYSTNRFTNLPEYARLKEAIPSESGLYMEFEFKSTTEVVNGGVLQREEFDRMGSGKVYEDDKNVDATEGFGGYTRDGEHWFYNMFIVPGDEYKTEPIVFKLTWAPPILLEEPIIVPITER